MESSKLKALKRKKKRVLRIKKKIVGTSERPRICVTKTNTQLFVQLIDDVNSLTLVSMSSLNKEIKKTHKNVSNVDSSKKLGEIIAAKCSEAGIKQAILDRRGNKYHGQIASLADVMRENGVQI
ncbi:MAG: 50S ribosomal protein L18 [Chlamydiae bacterium]|nr:50S ribosomal protein L18 [Chlamydiota bacterium]